MLKAVGAAALAVAMSTSIAMADTTFSDVPTNHWAYAAISQLQADGLIEGYPGGYFKGNRPLTRYELAVAVARLDKSVKDKLAALQTVTPADLAALRKLEDEFKVELDGVKKDLAGVKSDVATLKTQVAAQQATLDRQKFKLYYFLRAPGTLTDYVAAYNAGGFALPSGTLIGGPSNGGGAQGLKTGKSSAGTGYQVVRIRFDGVVDPKVSYSIRLEDRYYLANAFGNGPLDTSSQTPGFGSFPNNSAFRLNWANLTYKDPSGLYATVGRFAESSGDIGLAYSDYFNGAEVGYAKGKLGGFVGYSFNKAAVSNSAISPNASQTLFARLQFKPTNKLTVGASWINDLSNFNGLSGYNGATGFVTPFNPNIAIGSLDAIYQVNSKLAVEGEAIQRFGKDPFTGDTWDGKNAYWVKAFLGDTAPKSGNSYIDGGFIYAGLNSTGPHNEVEGTPDYQQFFIANPNGYQIGYLGAHHYIGANTSVGLIWQSYHLKSDLPVNITAGPLAGTPGNYLHKDDAQALFLETKLAF
jgi:hypothetical protein